MAKFFVQFCQFARHDGVAIPDRIVKIGEGIGDAAGRLEKHEGEAGRGGAGEDAAAF